MKKLVLFLFVSFVATSLFSQTLQSPEQFLGYKIGSRYTPHYKIVNYFKAVAQAVPDMVKIEKYGETNEGRELMLAYVTSASNGKQLEQIRQNNLALTGINKANAVVDGTPSIVWLSYNVHGNETSSSEAAMLTIFALVDPSNTQTKEWLKNTVVIIDPCINPDGRDRYVNWFNSVRGTTANPYPRSREHSEPWPGGRTNHYNFDLNRDWAWQSQIETRQRLVKYRQWMPQIHVDFHEQGINEPYYFAPAAEPFHEVITPWQRSFQNSIGRNHAKYFDRNGWLYFTKERFDLFYPSYGDTYPTYNGAIGMTFEQGGGPRGGLTVLTENNDTLTLTDRALHHYTTGLSTVEVASANASKLVGEFKKFFDDSRQGKGNPNKAYIITTDNRDKLNAVEDLLSKNGIEYGLMSSSVFKGMNYRTGKEEAGKLKKYHLAISTSQPQSVLARVLLEPSSNLTDSNTYDITAWSLPFAHDVDAYAVKDPVSIKNVDSIIARSPVPASSYGYLVTYQSFQGAKILAQLLNQGVKVRFAEKPFTYKEKAYDRGTLIILKNGNAANLQAILSKQAETSFATIDAIETGFMDKGPDIGSGDVRLIKAPKVALVTGEQISALGAGEIWHMFDQSLQYPLTLINATELSSIQLSDFNVVILPNGNYKGLNDRATADKLKDFVRGGGKLIAIQNAMEQMAAGDWEIKIKENKTEDKSDYGSLKKYENRERDQLPESIPGAIYKVQLDNTHPLAFGYPDTYFTLKQDATVFEFLKQGWNVGVLKKDNYVTGFAGMQVKSKLKDALVIGVQELGSGEVVYFADDPIFRSFWENGKLMLCNAVFLVGQ
ncbi:MAG: M14 family metallopeptidase [Chitinophagaceae bacterium]|nr:M14 family metallopeptidase [Chitinophagaceae bacterium]